MMTICNISSSAHLRQSYQITSQDEEAKNNSETGFDDINWMSFGNDHILEYLI